MELALSLGDTPKPFSLLDHHTNISQSQQQQQKMKDLGFCMGLGNKTNIQDLHFNTNMSSSKDKTDDDTYKKLNESKSSSSSSDPSPPPLQLDLLPFTPVLRSPPQSTGLSFPWFSKNGKKPLFFCYLLFQWSILFYSPFWVLYLYVNRVGKLNGMS